MHGEGKAKTSSAISEISADGGTDIAAGLELGLKVLRERKHRNAIASVLLLTDGQDAQSLHKLDDVMRDMPKCSIRKCARARG
jgi:Mg-chelatase subunit ChlD